MKLLAQYLFHRLDETKRLFAPHDGPKNHDESSESDGHLFFLITQKYDAMKQFFADLGFEVPQQDSGWQLLPIFNNGRACVIRRGGNIFCLEESTGITPSGPLYLEAGDIGVVRLLKLKLKYSVTELSDTGYLLIEPPDGGAGVFTAKT